MTGPEIRDARPGEYAALGELTAAAYAAIPGYAPDPGYVALLRDVAGRAAAARVLVATDGPGAAPVGTVTYVPGPGPLAEFSGEGECGMRMLAVAPAAQGRGVGRALVAACVGRARADGRTRLVLYTTPAMTAAHALYRDLGFTRVPGLDVTLESGLELRCSTLDLR